MANPQYLLALDQGTTSSRAILFDKKGTPVTTAQEEFKQHYPQSGWVEHDPEEIWASQCRVVLQALQKENISTKSIAAAGITNQRETVVVWDKDTGEAVHPAIVWQDRRTADYCKKLKDEGVEGQVREKTGLFLDPYFSATKVRWILDHVKGMQAKAEAGKLAMGTMDSWLVWKATGARNTLPIFPMPVALSFLILRNKLGIRTFWTCFPSRIRCYPKFEVLQKAMENCK